MHLYIPPVDHKNDSSIDGEAFSWNDSHKMEDLSEKEQEEDDLTMELEDKLSHDILEGVVEIPSYLQPSNEWWLEVNPVKRKPGLLKLRVATTVLREYNEPDNFVIIAKFRVDANNKRIIVESGGYDDESKLTPLTQNQLDEIQTRLQKSLF